MSGPSERTVEVNGQPCRVWEKGEGRPVGYLAGLGGLPRWTPFLERLSAVRRVVAPSLPGFPGGLGHDRLDSHLDWIAATLDLLEGAGLNGADLVGASVGGALAAEVAAVSPPAVSRLALVAPFGLYDPAFPPTDLFAQKPKDVPALLSTGPDAYTAHVAPPEGDDGEWAIVMVRASEAAARLLWPLGDTRLGRRLHRIRCPTLLVWGAEDKVLSPRYAEHFAAGLAAPARQVIIPGAGHLADFDAPDAVADAILTALA
jgi:pimeloyl-ACP methyl ester carboxylesterase